MSKSYRTLPVSSNQAYQNKAVNISEVPTVRSTSASENNCGKRFFWIGFGAVICFLGIAAVGIPLAISWKRNRSAAATEASSTITATTASATIYTTTSATTTITMATTTSATTATTAASRPVFALSQVINGQTVTCSSVVNTNSLFTECDNLQQGGLYAPNGITCGPGWFSTPSNHWDSRAFCQAFLSSTNTYQELYYDCNTSQTRFTWFTGGVWGTTADNGYTQSIRCYY